MPGDLTVGIHGGISGASALVTDRGELVTAPLSFSTPYYVQVAIASTAYRYGSHVLWFEDEAESFFHMIKFMDMVEEGKYEVPAKRNPDVLMARYLKVTLIQWNDIKRMFPSLLELQDAAVEDLKTIYGIGPKKAMNIKAVLLGDFI